VNRFEALTEKAAANLVGSGSREGELSRYKWDTEATGFAFVDITVDWVSERGPNLAPVSGANSTRHTRMVAVLELDGSPTSKSTKIIGGEYLDDESVGADRLTVPPFVWVADGAGPEHLPVNVDGDHHNPYILPEIVAELVELGEK
jgi:hypothetical protein